MYYYLYQIKNKINGKIYVGAHRTKNMGDGYMGSGKVIKEAIEKYGLENFEKTILQTFEDSESMYKAEKELVTEEFLSREDVYNLRVGGNGGFDFIIKSGKHRSVFYKGKPLSKEHIEKSRKTFKERFKDRLYEEQRKIWSENAKTNNPMNSDLAREKVREANLGKPKSEEHKRKISETLLGSSNTKGKKYPNRKKRQPVETRIETCPHCGKTGGIHGMTRWHFNNCKNKQG